MFDVFNAVTPDLVTAERLLFSFWRQRKVNEHTPSACVQVCAWLFPGRGSHREVWVSWWTGCILSQTHSSHAALNENTVTQCEVIGHLFDTIMFMKYTKAIKLGRWCLAVIFQQVGNVVGPKILWLVVKLSFSDEQMKMTNVEY